MFSLESCQQGGANEQQQTGGHVVSGTVGLAVKFSNKGVTLVITAAAGAQLGSTRKAAARLAFSDHAARK
jgi:hypothetical protein